MPASLTKYKIKDLPAVVQEADLINKVLEVESGSGADANYKVTIPTLVQAVANNLPGGNNAKVAVKTARFYDTSVPGYDAGSTTLAGLNPDFLCLFTTCWVEFPHPTALYILVYDGTPGAPLQVWRDGTFTGQKLGAKWVLADSLEARFQGIADFSPFTSSYNAGETVKYVLNGTLRLFSARIDLVKAALPGNVIPAPTGLANDSNWQEINAEGGIGIRDFLPGTYKKDEVVVFNHQLYRAKQDLVIGDFINQAGTYDNFPDLDVWEPLGGGGAGGTAYDDTAITARVTAVESGVDYLATTVGENYNELSGRISSIVSLAPDYVPGTYAKGQFVTNAGKVFTAKQAIQNSQVAPTATNVYWLQVSGGGGIAVQNSLTPGSSTDAASVDAVNAGLATKAELSHVDAQDAHLQNQITDTINTLSRKADLYSPNFDGFPTAPTQSAGTLGRYIATLDYVQQSFSGTAARIMAVSYDGTIISNSGAANQFNTGGKGVMIINRPIVSIQAFFGGASDVDMNGFRFECVDYGFHLYGGGKIFRNGTILGNIVARFGVDTNPIEIYGGTVIGQFETAADTYNPVYILDNVRVYPRERGLLPVNKDNVPCKFIMRNGAKFVGCFPGSNAVVVYENTTTNTTSEPDQVSAAVGEDYFYYVLTDKCHIEEFVGVRNVLSAQYQVVAGANVYAIRNNAADANADVDAVFAAAQGAYTIGVRIIRNEANKASFGISKINRV